MPSFTSALREKELDLVQFERKRFGDTVNACYEPFNELLVIFKKREMQAQVFIIEKVIHTITLLSANLGQPTSSVTRKSSNQMEPPLPSTISEFMDFILDQVRQLYGCQISTVSLSTSEENLLLDRLVREIIKYKFMPPLSLNLSDCIGSKIAAQLESEQSTIFEQLPLRQERVNVPLIEFMNLKDQWFELNKTIALLHTLSIIEANTHKATTVAETLLAKDHNSLIWQTFCEHFKLSDDHLLSDIHRFTTKTISFPNLLHLFSNSDQLKKKFPLFDHQAVKTKTSRNQPDGLFYLHHQHEFGQVLASASTHSKMPEGKSIATDSQDFFDCIIPRKYSDYLKAEHTILIDGEPQNFYTILSEAFNQRCIALDANSSIPPDERRYSFGLLIKEFESHVLWFISKAYLLDKITEKVKPLQSIENRPLLDIITKQLLISLRQELEIKCSGLTAYNGNNLGECESDLSTDLDLARELVAEYADSDQLPLGFNTTLQIAAEQEARLIILSKWAEKQSQKSQLRKNKTKQQKYHLVITTIEDFKKLLTRLCAQLFELQYSSATVLAIKTEIEQAYTTFVTAITNKEISPKKSNIPKDIDNTIRKLYKKFNSFLPAESQASAVRQSRSSMVSSLDIAKWRTSHTNSNHTADGNSVYSKIDEASQQAIKDHGSREDQSIDMTSHSLEKSNESAQKALLIPPPPPLPQDIPPPPPLLPVSNQSASTMKPEVASRKQTTESKTSVSQSSFLEDIRRRRNQSTTFGHKSANRLPKQQESHALKANRLSNSTPQPAQAVESQALAIAARPKPSFLNDIANLSQATKVKIKPSQLIGQKNSTKPTLSFLEQIRDRSSITLNHREPDPQKTPDMSNPLLKMMQRRLAVAGHNSDSESDSRSRSNSNTSSSDWDPDTDGQACTTAQAATPKK